MTFFFQKTAKLVENVAQVIGGKVVTKSDQLAKENFVTLAEVFQYCGCDRSVGNGYDRAIFSAKFGGAKADVLDGSALIADAAGVADLQRFVRENGDTAQQIFEGFLRTKAYGEAADSQSRQRRS